MSLVDSLEKLDMAKRKSHRWGKSLGADLAQIGRITTKGLSKVGTFVKEKSAKRKLPEKLQRLEIIIKKFNPTKKYRRELPYQMELSGWLKAYYGSIAIEESRGRSRPDIVVFGIIAIEVKGPTTNRELKTIADKIVRYGQHYESIIIVLFDVKDEQRYSEWRKGMQKRFPDAIIIRK